MGWDRSKLPHYYYLFSIGFENNFIFQVMISNDIALTKLSLQCTVLLFYVKNTHTHSQKSDHFNINKIFCENNAGNVCIMLSELLRTGTNLEWLLLRFRCNPCICIMWLFRNGVIKETTLLQTNAINVKRNHCRKGNKPDFLLCINIFDISYGLGLN